jgi:hypothetical protein
MAGPAPEVNDFLSFFVDQPGSANPVAQLPGRRALPGVGLVDLLGLPGIDVVS